MNPEFDEVLLTAYLDNEVTDSERMKVEEQLRASGGIAFRSNTCCTIASLAAQSRLSIWSLDRSERS